MLLAEDNSRNNNLELAIQRPFLRKHDIGLLTQSSAETNVGVATTKEY